MTTLEELMREIDTIKYMLMIIIFWLLIGEPLADSIADALKGGRDKE